MSLAVAIQMDPIETVNIDSDSSFVLGLEALRRGHSLFHYLPRDLFLRDGRVFATARPLQLKRERGNHFRFGPGGMLQKLAQGRRIPQLAAAEGIQNSLTVIGRQADHEMAGEIQPFDRPTEAARGVDIEDRERDGQAAPALDHADQVGVRQIVIGLIVALEAMALRQDLAQGPCACGKTPVASSGRGRSQVVADPAEPLPAILEPGIRMIEARQKQRCLGQIERLVARLAQPGQTLADRRARLCRGAHGVAAGCAAVVAGACGPAVGLGAAGWAFAGAGLSVLMRT